MGTLQHDKLLTDEVRLNYAWTPALLPAVARRRLTFTPWKDTVNVFSALVTIIFSVFEGNFEVSVKLSCCLPLFSWHCTAVQRMHWRKELCLLRCAGVLT
ncbi:hypothetical protein TraAM80_01203 [Trypanosoma rangeli]|uniref:Uncharacterized protein n=1 Tax=Trypanosoma rangeli TaxID=5698 RepID=A0A3R7MTF9_TRYRA|nr:uncharacterized protein TraAM80_01203 [Trypanosoma rangeli]RNF10938.1 hypothetical protein TraAM80_01203 [Trypanosoma rangeli]|eukprot:RNF10938.1 hypothetical protein TraAM80_01203 [Trypanosoma rangeli]